MGLPVLVLVLVLPVVVVVLVLVLPVVVVVVVLVSIARGSLPAGSTQPSHHWSRCMRRF